MKEIPITKNDYIPDDIIQDIPEEVREETLTPNNTPLIWALLLALFFAILYLFWRHQPNIEEMRIKTLQTQSWKLVEINKELNRLNIDKRLTTRCIEMNSNTGVLADCQTLFFNEK